MQIFVFIFFLHEADCEEQVERVECVEHRGQQGVQHQQEGLQCVGMFRKPTR